MLKNLIGAAATAGLATLGAAGAYPARAQTATVAACTAGAPLDVLWNGTWYPATAKRGPDAQGRCFIGYDGYGAHWDEWVGPERRRARALAPGAPAARTSTHAGQSPTAAASSNDFTRAPIRPGVYECYGQNAVISPIAFGILDGSSYMNSSGRRGRYSYDPGSGVRLLDPGPNPARFKRTSERSFRATHPDGSFTAFVCPLNTAKNPARRPW